MDFHQISWKSQNEKNNHLSQNEKYNIRVKLTSYILDNQGKNCLILRLLGILFIILKIMQK